MRPSLFRSHYWFVILTRVLQIFGVERGIQLASGKMVGWRGFLLAVSHSFVLGIAWHLRRVQKIIWRWLPPIIAVIKNLNVVFIAHEFAGCKWTGSLYNNLMLLHEVIAVLCYWVKALEGLYTGWLWRGWMLLTIVLRFKRIEQEWYLCHCLLLLKFTLSLFWFD